MQNIEETSPPVLSFPSDEADIVKSFYASSQKIVEYGSGGSTFFASNLTGKEILSVESDKAWAVSIKQKIDLSKPQSSAEVIWVDIGPTGKWGRPVDESHWNKFVDYALAPWLARPSFDPDVVLIDGRFRAACFAATAMHIQKPTIVLFDDYVDRPLYHAVEKIKKPAKIVGRLAIFELTPSDITHLSLSEIVKFFFLTNRINQNNSSYQYAVKKNTIQENHKMLRDESTRNDVSDELTSHSNREKEYRLEIQRQFARKEREFKRFRKWAVVLSLPSLIVLSPILLPFALLRLIYMRFQKKKKTGQVAACKANHQGLIYKAYQQGIVSGIVSAITMLQQDQKNLPAGTLDLFRAIEAETDQGWLKYMNSWSAARNLPAINLVEGSQPRFFRIEFEQVPSVPSPQLVTVIIACYNCEDTVRHAVQSILRQSWENLDIILVNDASTDRTGVVLDEISNQDTRVKVLHNRINVGPYISKNRALRFARGSYITTHDADDIATPSRIADQVASILSNPNTKATIGYMIRLSDSGAFTSPSRSAKISFDGMARLCFVSLMVEKETLRGKLGGWDSVRFGADSELISRAEILLGSNLKRVPEILMLCCDLPGSLTNDPETGVGVSAELYSIRSTYRDAFIKWHKREAHLRLRIPFPLLERKFDAPQQMIVPLGDVEKVIAADDLSEQW
jgi:glycosyltransferase involved in cell wall biosynthesis